MKKVKRMMFGGISKGVASAAQKAAAAPKMKSIGLGEGIARAAGVPVGTTVNAPARIAPIGGSAQAAAMNRMLASGAPAPQAAAMNRMLASGFKLKKGGSVSSASKRADGIATKGKTKGRMV